MTEGYLGSCQTLIIELILKKQFTISQGDPLWFNEKLFGNIYACESSTFILCHVTEIRKI